MKRHRHRDRVDGVNARARGDRKPAFTVERYGSIQTWDPVHGHRVNGEPYNPDEDGVHQPTRK